MSLFQWQERPTSALAVGGVIAPDERLPWPQTTAMGVQHVIAMFGATVLAPILMGFDPNLAIVIIVIVIVIVVVVVVIVVIVVVGFFIRDGGPVPYTCKGFRFVRFFIMNFCCILKACLLHRVFRG